MVKSYFFIVAATAVVSIGFSGGAAAQNLATGLVECRGISDNSDRLECFDQLANALDAENLPVSAFMEGGEDLPVEPVLTAEERFGSEDLPQTVERKRKEREKLKSLTAAVVDIGRNGRGKYVVILDNGQVWRQLNADTNRLRVPKAGAEGMSAEVKRKKLGGHSLYLNGDNRSIRVERIK